ncbi:MAG TPA: tryptophan--tRNA ligase [Candidatus Paceibacterota bacterium]
MTPRKKRLFTGLQPSGQLHIGNYFGTIKPTVNLFLKQEGFLMVADYHALTSLKKPSELRANIIENTKDYLAVGLNLENATLFQQSEVQEHAELAWVFECLVSVPFLMQAHAYKDKIAKGIEANAGLFNYPMLMAADILLYDTDIVPVGADQRQHVEYAREAASKFNSAFGETFVEPQERIQEAVAVVPGIDGKKMSKSYGNTIPLFAERAEITDAVMRIVTDSAGDFPEHVYAIHKLYKSEEELKPLYEEYRNNYKTLKELLAEDVDAFIKPLREKRKTIDEITVKNVLKEGAQKAREIAAKKMEDVRKKVGVTL